MYMYIYIYTCIYIYIYIHIHTCANRMTGRSIDAWRNERTRERWKSARLQISRVEPDAFWGGFGSIRRHAAAVSVRDDSIVSYSQC